MCYSRPGPPLTHDSALGLLVASNVTVGLGVVEPWEARNARFDLAWVRPHFPLLQARYSSINPNLIVHMYMFFIFEKKTGYA